VSLGLTMGMRWITGHLVWGEDGAAWACYEVEPIPYPHRSVRDARNVQARTAAALLGPVGGLRRVGERASQRSNHPGGPLPAGRR
jgi:hypothetical protein